MRAQPGLLETLVQCWDPDQGVFNLQGEILEITVNDIYFITGLSCHGEVVNLKGSILGVGSLLI